MNFFKEVKFLNIFAIALSLLMNSHVYAQSFGDCTQETSRTELDNLCPQAEGAMLPNCCPQAFTTPSKKCTYYVVKSNGQPYYVQSSFQTCQLDSGGTPQYTSHSCCEVSYTACIDQKVELDFFSRLIYRNNSCCIEGCPSANYWIDGLIRNPNMPQSKEVKKLTYQHILFKSSLPSQCIKAVIGSCPYQACQSNQYCPQPTPNPSPSPYPSPNPQPAPYPYPNPQPGPSPSPQPRPSPSPSPQPQPQPKPPVSGGDT